MPDFGTEEKEPARRPALRKEGWRLRHIRFKDPIDAKRFPERLFQA
jgi:hypothetical protein